MGLRRRSRRWRTRRPQLRQGGLRGLGRRRAHPRPRRAPRSGGRADRPPCDAGPRPRSGRQARRGQARCPRHHRRPARRPPRGQGSRRGRPRQDRQPDGRLPPGALPRDARHLEVGGGQGRGARPLALRGGAVLPAGRLHGRLRGRLPLHGHVQVVFSHVQRHERPAAARLFHLARPRPQRRRARDLHLVRPRVPLRAHQPGGRRGPPRRPPQAHGVRPGI